MEDVNSNRILYGINMRVHCIYIHLRMMGISSLQWAGNHSHSNKMNAVWGGISHSLCTEIQNSQLCVLISLFLYAVVIVNVGGDTKHKNVTIRQSIFASWLITNV